MNSFALKSPEAWLERLDLEPGVRAVFECAVLEELRLWPERSSLRVTLVLPAPAAEILPYEALKNRLRSSGIREVELKVRYQEGTATVGEYLALHFEDLCLGMCRELELDEHWAGGLDYRLQGEESDEVCLLAAGVLALRALAGRKAESHVADCLAWGCGVRPSVQLGQAEAGSQVPMRAMGGPAQSPILRSTGGLPSAVSGNEPRVSKAADPAPPPASPYGASGKPAPVSAPAASKEPAETALMGRAIPEKLARPITELVRPEDDVVLQGRIFDVRISLLKSGCTLAKLSVTDGTDSLLCVLRLTDGKPLHPELKVGAICRLRGKLEINRFEGDELVLAVGHATLLPALPGRRDDAPVKRVELHGHTKMSAMDAVTPVEAYIARAIEWGHAAVGVSDHGVVHSFPDAYKTARGRVKLLMGMEAYLVPDTDFIEHLRQVKEGRRSRDEVKVPEYWHCMIYAASEEGRQHLYELVSHSHTRSFYRKPLISKALLASKRGGLLIGTACEQGELYQAIVAKATPEELERVASFYDYLEVQPPENNAFMVRQGKANEEELRDNVRSIVALGLKLDKPVVATSDLHFLDPGDALYRGILQSGQGYSDADLQPPLYFHTTQEMLDAMAFLGPELAHKVTVEDTNRVADLCAAMPPVPPGRFFPSLPGADEDIRSVARARAIELYGSPLPPLVERRLERELDAVIGNKFAVLYEIARRLVLASLAKGYSVGSRGSVGSSFAAYCLSITEVNPLPSHERCVACRWIEFHEGERFAGVDLDARPCPSCGGPLLRDGFNIPFETFVGFKGDKVPDIDLNFAPEVQGEIQK
ncbi:MAG: PHP domain-containing protein, partial [bacterium]